MTYQLKAKESISRGIKRIATELVEKAIQELSTIDELGVDEAVHQARKRLKKIRAVIRLVRDSLGSTIYQQENARFRDLGNNLANLRDAKVQIEILDDLTAHFSDTLVPEICINIRRELRVDYRREYQSVLDEGVITTVKNQLKDTKDDIAKWKIKSDDWSAIATSLKRVYKRGYKGLHRASSEPTAENFHDWRKRVKYLRYQLRILNPIWSGVMREWVKQTHDLSDILGKDHDLAVLKEFISSQPNRFNRDNTLATLTTLCDRRRSELQSAAIILGNRIYTEKPKDFIDRLDSYWHIWRQETKVISPIN